MRCRWAALGVAVVASVVACAPDAARDSPRAQVSNRPAPAGDTAQTTTTAKPPPKLVAKAATSKVKVYDSPGAATPVHVLDHPRPSAAIGLKSPLVMLVREDRGDWLEVLIPVRPNGSSGWIRRSEVTIDTHDFRISVDLDARRITVWNGNQEILHEPVGVGRSATGTPPGLFYTTELLRPVRQPAYGPYAFALSGFSEVHRTFAGGPGQLGIHGTNDPASVGTSVSNGCIRMTNTAITFLARTLPPAGVPVEILP